MSILHNLISVVEESWSKWKICVNDLEIFVGENDFYYITREEVLNSFGNYDKMEEAKCLRH